MGFEKRKRFYGVSLAEDRPTRAAIAAIVDSDHSDGEKIDKVYALLVGREGLYGKAFFGHRATKTERRRLDRLLALAYSIVSHKEAEAAPTESEASA